MNPQAITAATAAADTAAEGEVVDAAPEAGKAALDFKAKLAAPIPPEMKAVLDAAVDRVRNMDTAALAAEEAAAKEAAAAKAAEPKKPDDVAIPGKADAKPAAKPAGKTDAKPADGKAPADTKADPPPPAIATPDQIIATSKAQARTAHQLRQREAELGTREKKVAEILDKVPLLKTDPEAFFQAVGADWGDAVRAAVAKKTGKPVAAPTTDAAVKALEARVAAQEAERKSEREAAQKAEEERDLAAYKGTIAQDIAAAGEELELCALEGQAAIDAIFKLQDLHYAENGATLPIREAAKQIEAVLEKRYAPIAAAKRFSKPPAASVPPVVAPKAPTAPAPGPKQSPTLTSQHVPTTAAAQPADPPENETDEQKLERLARKHKLFPGTQR